MSLNKLKALTLLLIMNPLLESCGQRSHDSNPSKLDFIPSRPNSQRYAYLEEKDTQDVFLFGASVVKTTGFTSAALNMTLRPIKVTLSPSKSSAKSQKLDVLSADSRRSKVLSFDLKTVGKQMEVDFASAGNDLTLQSIINQVGGMTTSESADEEGIWVSSGAPEVLNVSQDENTIVVDLNHTVKQAKVETSFFGRRTVVEIPSAVPGQVQLKIFLKRQNSLPTIGGVTRTVADGKAISIGYFGADFVGKNDNVPVQRFNLGDAEEKASSITYYLKDVPAEYQDVAKKAVLTWNEALGKNSIKVEIAPKGVDAGDPRYSVVKWFDGTTEKALSWAGVAKMIVDPDSGVVMSGSLYIQGNTLIKMYDDIVAFSNTIATTPRPRVTGTLASLEFSHDEGEQPVAPFLTDLSKDFDQYMKDYYLETITHEVGHTLGLRHNFRASTQQKDGATPSVMDYAPRAERDNDTGLGFYDTAAIRWAYFGEKPQKALPFCTDEDLWIYYDCNQGDWGDPIQNTVQGIKDSLALLSTKPIPVTRPELISSFGSSLENAHKIKKLMNQVPESIRAKSLADINGAIDLVDQVKADSSLSTADQAVVEANLVQVRELAKKTVEELKANGKL